MNSYDNSKIIINGVSYSEPIAINGEKIITNSAIPAIKDMSIKDLKSLGFSDYEVVLLGTGNTLEFPDWELVEEAQCLGTPLEIMNTGAACRTFAILAGEGRKVLAILQP
ncbi:hypothetical protein GJS41_09610 [Kangiella sp. HZ709]|nr:hypothetical protein [Kangiella sp. HZ709]